MRKLIIDKFGPVEHAEIEIKRYNLFIGQQSIGKSTIAKIITMLSDRINLIRLLQGDIGSWRQLLDEYSLGAFLVNQNYRINYLVREKSYEASITIARNGIAKSIKVNGAEVTDTGIIAKLLLEAKPIYHKDQLYKQLSYIRTRKDYKNTDILSLLKDSLYVPAERNIVSSVGKLQPVMMLTDSVIEKNLLRFMIESNNAKEYQHEVKIPLLGISYIREDDEDYFVMDGRKTKWPLRIASSGIQSLLPLYIVLNYALKRKEYSSYVIEEPECNLFPDKQVELLKHLLNNISEESMTLTITTHSPYMLSAMNNYLLAGTIVEKYGKAGSNFIKTHFKDLPVLNCTQCSVYSLGMSINEGVYCKSLIDEDSKMIDANTLDEVSFQLSNEFEALDNYILEKER